MAGIFLINAENNLVEMSEAPYDSEAVLQELLARYPNLLTGESSRETTPRRWLLVSREVSLLSEGGSSGTWSVDHLFLDQDGVPTIVEVKRSSSSEIRRSVVGQMLDYAANAVVYWPVERIRALFEAGCETLGADPDTALATLTERDDEVESFWQSVATNLQAQRVRLIFVADAIPPELRRIIEFLNGQMSPAEVLGVEVKQYSGQGLRTLVPRVIGMTAEAESRKGQATTSTLRGDWDWDAYEKELRVPHERIEVGRALLERVLETIASRQLPWRSVFRKGYVAIQRPGGYNVAVIDVWWARTPRLAVKLPAPPDTLGLTSPYPEFAESWSRQEREWGWTIPSGSQLPDVGAAIELAIRFNTPESTASLPQ